MTWLSWAVLYEGDSDASYFDVLLPRLMTEIVFTRGTRHSDVPLFQSVPSGGTKSRSRRGKYARHGKHFT